MEDKLLNQLMNGKKTAFIMLDDGEGSITLGLHGDLDDMLHGVGAILYDIADKNDIKIAALIHFILKGIASADDEIKMSKLIQGTVTKHERIM